MASVNKVILIGNLGNDPDLKYTPSGAAVANFSIATKESWKSKEGTQETKTEWHKIVAWGKLAEICGEYLAKGRPVYIEGKLQTREWTDKDGGKRYTTEIVAQAVQFLGSAGGSKQDVSTRGNSESAGQDIDPLDDPIPF